MFTLVLPPADLFVLSNTFLSRMYIVRLFSCIFSANSPCWVWMLARLIECVAFCWIGRTLFENQQPHRQRWEDTDLREIVNIFHVRLDMDFGILEKKMAKLSWFQVCLFCVCVLLTFLGSIVSTVQARGRGGFFEVRFPSERPGQWHPTTSVHIQNIGLNYNCRPKAFYDHSIRIETKGDGRLSIFLIWEAK